VTESDLLFDTWAWWEYLHGTNLGTSLRDRFVAKGGFRPHASAITLAELSARLTLGGAPARIAQACGAIRRTSRVWDVTADIAQEAGPARATLRESSPSASLADAIIRVTAQRAGASIVSANPAFKGITGVLTG
jgi:predicted nucleic acid-binding protein